MPTFLASFDTQVEADSAIARLRDLGVGESHYSLISHLRGQPDDAPARPASTADDKVDAAALGAAVGVMVGGAFLGPVGALLGAAAGGGLAAAVMARGVDADRAREYEARLHEGRFVLAVNADDGEPREAEIHAALDSAGARQVAVES